MRTNYDKFMIAAIIVLLTVMLIQSRIIENSDDLNQSDSIELAQIHLIDSILNQETMNNENSYKIKEFKNFPDSID